MNNYFKRALSIAGMLFWEQPEAVPALNANIRVVRGSLDAMR